MTEEFIKFNNHWSSQKFSKNMLQDALIKHVLGLVNYRMADVGEVLEVNANLKNGDEQTWISACLGYDGKSFAGAGDTI